MRVIGTSILLAVASLVSLSTTPGQACSFAPPEAGPLSITIPESGALPIAIYCSMDPTPCDDPAKAFEIRDAAGSPIAGNIVEQIPGPTSGRVTLAWRPRSGWTVGASYQFQSLLQMGNVNPVQFSVVASLPEDQIVLTPSFVAARQPGTGVYCGESETTCGTMAQYFYPDMAQGAELSFVVESSSTWSSQSVVSVQGWTAEESLTGSESGVMPGEASWSIFRANRLGPITFTKQSSQYCYRVSSRRFGQTNTKVLAEGCLPHGDLPQLGRLDDPMEFGFDRCDGPVDGYESDWCDWADASDLCGAEKREHFPNQCAKYDSVCKVDAPPPPSTPDDASTSDGCRMASAPRTTAQPLQLLLAAMGLAFGSRAYRRRRASYRTRE